MTTKIDVDANGLRAMLQRARQIGTVDNWTDVALQWIDAAEKEIERLNTALDEAYRQRGDGNEAR